MNHETFKAGMAYMAAAYSKELNTQISAVYWDQLGELHGDEFMIAVRQAVGCCKWFPTVAEIRQMYGEAMYRKRLDQGRVIDCKPMNRKAARAAITDLRRRLKEKAADQKKSRASRAPS